MRRACAALLLTICLSTPGFGALLAVTLETAPISVSGPNFAILRSPATSNARVSYAPLVNAAVSTYSFSPSSTTFVNAAHPNTSTTGYGQSRIDGRLAQSGQTTSISSTIYSYIQSSVTSDFNQVLGRLKIELGGSNFTWETRLPPPEMARSFSGVMKSDPLGVEDAPTVLLAYHTYYFHFVYRVAGGAPDAGGGGGTPFSRSARDFDVLLNETNAAPIPEPASFAVLSFLGCGAVCWIRRRKAAGEASSCRA
jgi:hypothetical protein